MKIGVKHYDGKSGCIVLDLKEKYTIELYGWDNSPTFISEIVVVNKDLEVEFSIKAESGNTYITFDEVLNKVVPEKDDAKIFEYIKEACIEFIKLK